MSFLSQWGSSHTALIHIYWPADSLCVLDLYVSWQTIVKPQSLFCPFINRCRNKSSRVELSVLLGWPFVGLRAGLTQDQAKLQARSSLQIQQTDLICMSNHLGNHRNRNFSTGSRFPTATSDQRHSKSVHGIAGRHLDSGRSPCSMTASVCAAQYELRREVGIGRGEEDKMGGTATLNTPLSPCALPPQPPSSHLSSCLCPSNAFKWVKSSTSASALWDVVQATVLLSSATTDNLKGTVWGKESWWSHPRRKKHDPGFKYSLASRRSAVVLRERKRVGIYQVMFTPGESDEWIERRNLWRFAHSDILSLLTCEQINVNSSVNKHCVDAEKK